MKPFVLLFLLISLEVYAQTAPDSVTSKSAIQTDRPDQTEGSSVVPLGTLQVELGLLRQEDWENGKKSVDMSYPTALLRYGIMEKLELRLITGFHVTKYSKVNESPQAKLRGLDAFAIGTKIYVTEEKGQMPEISFIGHLTLPSGSTLYKLAYVAPDFRFSLSHTLSPKASLGYNLGYAWDGTTPEGAFLYTLAACTDLGERWGTYAEFFGEKPEQGNWRHSFDAGFTFSPQYNIQFDVSAGIGLNKEAPDYYLSAGFSFRLFN